ncbi:MAG: hypothetical protein ACFFDT_31435 [Candidatus Hodarchaeota archaeon]
MRQTKNEILEGINQSISSSKFIANNTLEILYANGDRAIRLHNTDVITFKADGTVILNSGGWRTPTTKERINRFCENSSWQLIQEKSQWYLCVANSDVVEKYYFYDGMRLDSRGRLKGKKIEIQQAEKKVKEMKKKISQYVNLIDKLEKLPYPNNGDCWFCLLHGEDGQSLGDFTKDAEHLLSHLEEGYLHGAILVNSMREAGYQDRQIGFHYQLDSRYAFKNSLRKYLQKRLLRV